MDRRREACETRGRDFSTFNRVEYLGIGLSSERYFPRNKIYLSKSTDASPICPRMKKIWEILKSCNIDFSHELPFYSCLFNICSIIL